MSVVKCATCNFKNPLGTKVCLGCRVELPVVKKAEHAEKSEPKVAAAKKAGRPKKAKK